MQTQNKFRTLELAKNFYQECQKIELSGAARNQFARASLSIVLNLAEGSGKPTNRDRKRFYFISYGSLREVATILSVSSITYLDKQIDCLGAHIWKLTQNPGGLD